MGSTLEVRIAGVNIPRRQLDLEPVYAPTPQVKRPQAAKVEKKVERKERRTACQAAKAEKWAKRGPPAKKGRRKGKH
jgi:hypothetical protein